MKKISRSTFYAKKLFPSLGVGFIVFFIVVSLQANAPIIFIIIPMIMAIVGFKVFATVILKMSDDVYDNGNELIFHKGSKVQHVKLRDIINIEHIYRSAPIRVIVHVNHQGTIGSQLGFLLPVKLGSTQSPFVKELVERIDQAKQ